MNELLNGLTAIVQYRRKDGVHWITMAAFDVVSAAEIYYDQQRMDED